MVFYILYSVLFIGSLIFYQIQYPWRSDIKYFIDFVDHYPVFYTTERFGFIGTVYFPYFAIFFYVFWLMGDHPTLIIFSTINFVCLLSSIKTSNDLPNSLKWTIRINLLLMASTLAEWANVEMMVTYIFILFCRETYLKKNLSFFKMFLLAFFSFKIISIIFMIPIIYFINKPMRLKLLVFYFASIVLLNVPFIILNPQLLQIDYLLWIIGNRPSATETFFFSVLARTSSSIPAIWIIIEVIKKIVILINLKSNHLPQTNAKAK